MISNTRFTRKEERFQDKKIFTRKSPYVNANLFDINVKKKGLDGKLWKVISVKGSSRQKGHKKWARVSKKNKKRTISSFVKQLVKILTAQNEKTQKRAATLVNKQISSLSALEVKEAKKTALIEASTDPNVFSIMSLELLSLYRGEDLEEEIPDQLPDVPTNTILQMMSFRGNIKATQILLELDADVHHADALGRSPLFLAAMYGHNDVIESLHFFNASISQTSTDGRTPLHAASAEGHAESIQLLASLGANIHQKDLDGRTPLFEAAMVGRNNSISALIDLGASATEPNKDNVTPVEIARIEHNEDTVSLLENHISHS
tara:strand:- start:4466 stop:5422 length:957 start_codon:yes stop_codon:yes gene_type:complete